MNFIEAKLNKGRLELGQNVIDLTHIADAEVLEKYEGGEVVFGFRPEAVKAVLGSAAGRAYRIKCFANLVELLGDNTNVYVNFDGMSSILKVDPHNSPAMGSSFEFDIPWETVYLFDKHTEKRIKLRKE